MASARQTSSPAPAEEAQALRLLCRLCLQRPFPSPFSAHSGGPGGSAHQFLSEGAVRLRTGATGWEGPSSQAPVPISSGLGHTHMMLLYPGPLRSVRESNLETSNHKDVKNIKQ